MSNSCIAEISVDTMKIIDFLSVCAINEEITYKQLAQCINRASIPNGMLTTARKRLLADKKMVFGTIRKVGLIRLSDAAIVENSGATFYKIQRSTKREAKKLNVVDFETLPTTMKLKHSANCAVLAIMYDLSSPKKQLAIASKIANENQKLSMVQAIDSYREAISNEK